MVDIVALTTAAMVLSNVVMFAIGRRIRGSSWLSSLVTIATIATLSWLTQSRLTGHELPLSATLLVVLALGSAVVAKLPDWNAVGHTAFVATIAASISYIGYAGYVLANAQLGAWSFAFALVLFALQCMTLSLLIGTMFETIDVVCRTRWQGPGGTKRAVGTPPKVSIHVPIHAEPPDMVIETLEALARLDYANFEVLVIDNNTRDENLWKPVEAHCATLGERFRFFHLLPWPGYKSGALNFAITETAADAELIAVVDADYIVEPNFLIDLAGHFDDPKVAFVQTPQDYRDGEDRGRYGTALYRAYMYFFQVSMRSRNESNSIIYAGTMGLIRKSALSDVGGWSEWCITEDAELSLRLLEAGYTSVFVLETFGRGLMPLDLAGLKKQRFRWAFGGMQILRLHMRTLIDPSSRLTFAQRFGFINGGLQWLNDLLALLYTIVLFVGTVALLAGGSFFSHAMTQSILIVSPLFLFLSIVRFMWAFRVQNRCSWNDAADAMSVLIGLTWVVGLACVRGLFSKNGVFLRTPKQSERPRLADALRVVRIEGLLGSICLAGAAGIAFGPHHEFTSARVVTIGLLCWQAATFLAAVRLSAWSHNQKQNTSRRRLLLRSVKTRLGSYTTELRTAAFVLSIAAAIGALFFISVKRAPQSERIALVDPLRQFIPARSVLPSGQRELAGALLVQEGTAAKAGDIDAALALWSPDGEVIDWAGSTRGRPARIWRGIPEIRARYRAELTNRHYRSLSHDNPRIEQVGDRAIIVNDLNAVVVANGTTRHIFRPDSDRWTLHRSNGRWLVTTLEVNR